MRIPICAAISAAISADQMIVFASHEVSWNTFAPLIFHHIYSLEFCDEVLKVSCLDIQGLNERLLVRVPLLF